MTFTIAGKDYPFRFDLDRKGEVFSMYYDNHTSELVYEDGSRAVTEKTVKPWMRRKERHRIAPHDPGTKDTDAIKTLKIQLGLGCNYKCSYCLQATLIQTAENTSAEDAKIFKQQIQRHGWFGRTVQRIELWGGEPFLYWHKIKPLLPFLKERWPEADIVIVTNGSMFTQEIIDAMVEYEVMIAISHDGPGHTITRGPDPLDDPDTAYWLRRAIDTLMPLQKVQFNVVITSVNYDPNAILDWFEERFKGVNVGFEGVGYDYHGDRTTRWTQEQLADMRTRFVRGMMDGSLLRSHYFIYGIQQIIDTWAVGESSASLGQRCGMDREDTISVDLLGNVTTCQNTGAKSDHNLGHMMSPEKISLDTSWHWSYRQECSSCPVLQQCAGGCMYIDMDSENWAASCHSEFHLRTAFLAAALFHLTNGGVLKHIGGTMIRPDFPEVPQLQAAE